MYALSIASDNLAKKTHGHLLVLYKVKSRGYSHSQKLINGGGDGGAADGGVPITGYSFPFQVVDIMKIAKINFAVS